MANTLSKLFLFEFIAFSNLYLKFLDSKERKIVSHDTSKLKIISSKVIKIGHQNNGLTIITCSLLKP
jgi:hypothetical protein